VRDREWQVTEFDFLTKAPRRAAAYALPGAVKGFRHPPQAVWRLPWQRVVAPGEAYAATGFPVSQALACGWPRPRILSGWMRLWRRNFWIESASRAPRAAKPESALGETLSQIRAESADGFYRAMVAQRIVAYSDAQGGGHLRRRTRRHHGACQGPARSRSTGRLCHLAARCAHRGRRFQPPC
jgi:gamma-glutamyltranspeptidase/glutathione hydrolase